MERIILHLIRKDRIYPKTLSGKKVESLEKRLRGLKADLVVIVSPMLISDSLLNTLKLVISPTNGKVINLKGETVVY